MNKGIFGGFGKRQDILMDLTNAAEDYLLAVGETAFLDYINATSVPLHVATQEGEYEISICGDRTVDITNANLVLLAPNAVSSISNTIMRTFHRGANTTGTAVTTTNTLLQLSSARCEYGKYNISTFTFSKLIDYVVKWSSSIEYYSERGTITWNDTTTSWTSLGTITFPFAQSGKIIIKRII